MEMYKIEKCLNVLKDFGFFEEILKDREKALCEMINFEKEYEIGRIFGCKINFKVYFEGNPGDKEYES